MEKIIAITGHRPNKLNNEYGFNGPLSKWIKGKIDAILDRECPDKLMSGMALGIDTLFALIAIERDLPLIATIPFIGQEKKWPQESQDVYNKILSYHKIEKCIVCDGGYAPEKMQIRNEFMVDRCYKLIAVWDGSYSGTGNAVKYAKKIDREIIRINPKDCIYG
jgi:uncharacterized phage-like protein YoqJ